ncbi:uncharacterized protein TM35_000016760 [Trypanosoma theileri]|uniref:Uncharacterized protein n=1 Tax=Trypanosoma theileri TaxID=67003 RepID=A0A1X0PB42_9TRYP|nr:uncharacterized protein TM35_000016760 [Trypanosoma theileri]ORC93799.1 hypothetical protein TM35_000016760 [Trypanosoma theileri]
MRRNVEAAGVHLADCTLLWCRHELELEKGRAESNTQSSSSCREGKGSYKSKTEAMQLASPYIRVDGELIAANIALSAFHRAEAERESRLSLKKKREDEVKEMYRLHDEIRHTIIDAWALGFENLAILEKKELNLVRCRERTRRTMEWHDEVVQQHLADEARLWADEEQVLAREREEGRAAYRQSLRTKRR